MIKDEDDKVILYMRGELSELLMMTYPSIYRKWITVNKKGETVLYIKSLNAIYGITKAALLLYNKFVGYLTSVIFKLDPYGTCVANKIINDKKMIVVWNVDGTKVSHYSKKIFTRMEKWLSKTYKRIFEDGSGKMKISKGNIHEHLVMTVDYS